MTLPRYFEHRKASARGTDSLAADIARHLHARQYLGKTVIVCEHPTPMLSTVRKQWLKLARTIQKQRASTLNADKILKYTHMITHMQHLRFSTKSPEHEPSADVFVLTSDQLNLLPAQCFSLYVDVVLKVQSVSNTISQLPADALIIDYRNHDFWLNQKLQPKKTLEQQVTLEWRQVQHFLDGYSINISTFSENGLTNIEAVDDALDTLLGVSHTFLSLANDFQRALELARPLRLSKHNRQQYDAFILLAHRVQALSPSSFTKRFLQSYNEDDTFFLTDHNMRRKYQSTETLSQAIARHTAAGRTNLAQALSSNSAAFNTR